MKKIIYILFLIGTLQAQNNLVPNWSFEDSAQCPDQQGAMYCFPWETPTLNTPDYFHSCNQGVGTNWNVSIPQNFIGYQYAKTGSAYCGFGSCQGNNREYIETNLTDTLIAGKKYCVKFNTSLADSCKFTGNKIGAYFRTTKYLNYSTVYVLPFVPQIEYSGANITDTIGWMEVKGEFKADGGEKWVIIGNFAVDSLSNIDTLTTGTYYNYYYVDDVSVYESAEANAGIDTFFCNVGDSVQLGMTGRTDLFYSWQPISGLSNPNISNPKAAPLAATTYTLTVTDTNSFACNSVLYDTVTVYKSCVSIEEKNETKEIKIFPNPVNNEIIITLENKENSGGHLVVYNSFGEIVLLKQLEKQKGEIKQTLEVLNYPNGIYFLNFNLFSGQHFTKKFVVHH